METFYPVHLRHQVIHQNAVIMLVLGQPQTFRAAGRRVDLHLGIRQELAHHHQVHLVVVHHQHMGTRRLEAVPVLLPLVHLHAGSQGECPQLPLAYDVLLQCDQERGSVHVDAVDADLASHQLHKLLDYAQPQPGALDVPVLLLVHTLECIEYIGDVLLLHPLARVLHGVPDPHPVHAHPLAAHGKGDGAFLRIFHRVVQQIDQHLLDAHLIAAEHAGHGRIHLQPEFQPLFPGLDPFHVHDLREELPGLIGHVHNLHFARLDFGQVKDIVDQGQQHLAGSLDVPGVLGHLVGNVPPQDHLVEADDRIDGRAYLMAHAGEEMVLRLVQLLDFFLLALGELVLLLVEIVLEQEQYACQEAHQYHGAGRVEISLGHGIGHHQIRIVVGQIVADDRLHYTQQKEHPFPPSLQGDADIDEAEHEPLRPPAVESASREEHHRVQQQEQHHYGRSPRIDAFLFDADFGRYVDVGQAQRQYEQIHVAPAQNQDKDQRHHADACDKPEHPLSQTYFMVKNDFQPLPEHGNLPL